MKILVCMKQVPQKDAPLKLNEQATWVQKDVGYEVNSPTRMRWKQRCN